MPQTTDKSPRVATRGFPRSTAPDRRQVPFDVTCACCGHDLRGLQDPKCPRCSLTFDWADAVPIEELLCEQCGYHLFGLTQTRCPECGESFTWPEALAAHHRRKYLLFEHRWRTHPVRSFLASTLRTLRPRKLWTQVKLHDRPPVKPLLAISLASLLLASMLSFILAAILILSMPGPSWTLSIAELSYVLQNAASAVVGIVVPAIIWFVFSLAALMVFRQSMRLYRVRAGHVIRVWSYAVPLSLVWLVVFMFARGLVKSSVDMWIPYSTAMFAEIILEAAGWGIVVLFCWQVLWSLRCGYRHYMRMDHAFWVALASQAIAVLATMTLLATMSYL